MVTGFGLGIGPYLLNGAPTHLRRKVAITLTIV